MTRRAAVALAGCLTACGYHFVQNDRLFGRERIALMPFAEDVPLGLAPELNDRLTALLASSGLRTGASATGAEATLDGRVVGAATRSSPTGAPTGNIPAYNVMATIQATLKDASGKILWRGTVSADEDFLAGAGEPGQAALATEASRRRALSRLSEKIASALYEQLAVASASVPVEER